MEYIYVWSDGTWCWEEDLNDYLTFMSDDYTKYTPDCSYLFTEHYDVYTEINEGA